MSLLEIRDLTHSYGEKILYKDACLDIYKGEHVGIVGQNGAGKSTFMKTLMGQEVPDSGIVKWQPKITVGHLDQYAQMDKEVTIFDYLRTAYKDLYDIEQKINDIYASMTDDFSDDMMNKVARLQDQLDQSDFYSIDAKIQKVAAGLGVTAIGLDKKISEISGGQRAKVILSKLLLDSPDMLLLDEPTNFLDKEHVDWLSKYLSEFDGTFAVISHDFDFLDRICNVIVDIEMTSIDKYTGNYSAFTVQKAARREQYIKNYEAQQRQIAKAEDFIARNKARAATAGMARSRQKMLDKMEVLDAPTEHGVPTFEFKCIPTTYNRILEVKDLEVGYYYPLLQKLNFSLENEKKIVIKGFNGIGKSTLIKTLVGEIPSLGGSFKFAPNIKVGYYEQDLNWPNDMQTPLEYLHNEFPRMTEKDIRRELAKCLIKSEHIQQPLKTLSGGEQAKVKLCKLFQKEYTTLILDEPTNHIDQDAKEALRDAIINFRGTVLIVSHEASWYRDFADRVIDIEKMVK